MYNQTFWQVYDLMMKKRIYLTQIFQNLFVNAQTNSQICIKYYTVKIPDEFSINNEAY